MCVSATHIVHYLKKMDVVKIICN